MILILLIDNDELIHDDRQSKIKEANNYISKYLKGNTNLYLRLIIISGIISK